MPVTFAYNVDRAVTCSDALNLQPFMLRFG